MKLMNAYGWYPQVIGEDPLGTDKLWQAGISAALHRWYCLWAEMIVVRNDCSDPIQVDPYSGSSSTSAGSQVIRIPRRMNLGSMSDSSSPEPSSW